MILSKTVVINGFELADEKDPVDFIYRELLDSGAPIDKRGNLSPGTEGFVSWTVNTNELCFSWGQADVDD